MSESENTSKAGAWTEEAKCQFLLHIIAQLKGDNNKAICWSKINMPGRTTKSLQNQWTKINKTISEMEATAANGEEGRKEPMPRKRTPRTLKVVKKEYNQDDEEDRKETKQEVTPVKAGRKRGNTGATPQSTKKVKKESSEDDEVMGGQI